MFCDESVSRGVRFSNFYGGAENVVPMAQPIGRLSLFEQRRQGTR